jgi:hypothetical protein
VSDRFSRVLLALMFICCGVIVSSAGIFLLQYLSHVYRPIDLAYRQSEQTFYDWLAAEIKQDDPQSKHVADLIAQRLMIMAVTERRDTVNSMMIEYFWDELAPPGTDRRPIYSLMDRATKSALKSLPLAGDLWLFAAWLRTMTNGFDEKAAEYLLMSQRFTPREKTLVLSRLDFITQVVSTVSAEVKNAGLMDLSVAQRLDPDAVKEYSEKLKQ